MANDKAKRSNPSAQLTRRRPNPQLKAQLFDSLQHLNRGYGIVLANLGRLEKLDCLDTKKGKPRIFSTGCLRTIHNRTEELRASANHELLQTLAGREGKDALRFARIGVRPEKRSNAKRHQ